MGQPFCGVDVEIVWNGVDRGFECIRIFVFWQAALGFIYC